MPSDVVIAVSEEPRILNNPWPWAGTGLGLALAGYLSTAAGLPWVGLACTVVGALAAGGAVTIRPTSWPVLLVAAATALFAGAERDNAGWDSALLLFNVLAVVAAVSAFLVVLPRRVRRAAVLLLVVIHFGGICTAVMAASPAWVPQQLWTLFYRPYLQFMYLNNAYHFYSPEPGPAPLLYFRIEYEGGKHRWLKVPDVEQPEGNPDGKPHRPDGSLLWPKVEYTRRLSLAESTNWPGQPAPEMVNLLFQRRLQAAQVIPLDPERPFGDQYRPPNDAARRWIAAYARHVARTFPYRDGDRDEPTRRAKSVRIYRVIHEIIPPSLLERGWPPDAIFLFKPYYLGEFDPDGKMMPSCLPTHEIPLPGGGKVNVPEDPLLYWLCPILPVPKPEAVRAAESEHREPGSPYTMYRIDELDSINYMIVHAGDGDGRISR